LGEKAKYLHFSARVIKTGKEAAICNGTGALSKARFPEEILIGRERREEELNEK